MAPVPLAVVSPAPRSKIRARRRPGLISVNHETFVRFGNSVVLDDLGADLPELQLGELDRVGDADRALGVADLHVLKAPPPSPGRQLTTSVVDPRRIIGAAQPRPAHVDRARRLGGDRRSDLAGRGLDRERSRVGPATPAEVQDRLAAAVARQLRLGAVRVEDPQPSDVAGLVRLREQQDPVGGHARVRRADRAHAGRRQLERQRGGLDDHVVVAERVPLLELHARAV